MTEPSPPIEDSAPCDVLLVAGEARAGDELAGIVGRICRPCRLTLFLSLRDALASAPESWLPDLAVVFEPFPGATMERTLLAAVERWPLTRWICAAGPWCESAMRRGTAWPPATWCPMSRLEQRLRSEWLAMRGGGPFLPLTAEREEVVLLEQTAAGGFGDCESTTDRCAGTARIDRSSPACVFDVAIADRALRTLVGSLIEDAGGRVEQMAASIEMLQDAWTGRPPRTEGPARVVVWDADPWSPARQAVLDGLTDRGRPVVWLLTGEPDPASVIARRGPVELIGKLAVAYEIPRRVALLAGRASGACGGEQSGC